MFLIIREDEDRVTVRGTGLDREDFYTRDYSEPHIFPTYELAKAYKDAKEIDREPYSPTYELHEVPLHNEIFVVRRHDGKAGTACFSEQGVKKYLSTKKKELYTVQKIGSVPE